MGYCRIHFPVFDQTKVSQLLFSSLPSTLAQLPLHISDISRKSLISLLYSQALTYRSSSWWSKYNYVLSAGLDSGLAISALLIFFCLQYPRNGTIGENSILTWWGNWGAYDNVDGNALGVKYVDVEAGEFFGPSQW